MPNQPQGATTAKAPTTDERIRVLEEKVDDLASFVGRVTDAVFGKRFDEHDRQDDGLLVWKEVVPYSSTENGEVVGDVVGWWEYRAEAVGGEASDA